MSGKPYFPPPGGSRGYREPAPQPLLTDPGPPARPRVVVTRPTDPEAPPTAAGREPPPRERLYWARQRLFYRHPRLVGAMLLVTGTFLAWAYVDLQGGGYRTRGATFGPCGTIGTMLGFWFLVTGRPTVDGERTPDWWKVGSVVMGVVGFGLGLALLGGLAAE